jgi:hypothetical protein
MKMKTKLFFTVLAFMAIAMMANAQDKTTSQSQNANSPVERGTYIDTNNNGICDNNEGSGAFNRNGQRMANATKPGKRRGLAAGQGRGFGPGQGRGFGPGQGRGVAPGGRNFTDENKNGICDFHESSTKK